MKNDLLSLVPFQIKVYIIGNDLEDIRKYLRPAIAYFSSGSIPEQGVFSWVGLFESEISVPSLPFTTRRVLNTGLLYTNGTGRTKGGTS
jgi:hypothetical protein